MLGRRAKPDTGFNQAKAVALWVACLIGVIAVSDIALSFISISGLLPVNH